MPPAARPRTAQSRAGKDAHDRSVSPGGSSPPSLTSSETSSLKGLSLSKNSSGGTSRSGSELPSNQGDASIAVRHPTSSDSLAPSPAAGRGRHFHEEGGVVQGSARLQEATQLPLELVGEL